VYLPRVRAYRERGTSPLAGRVGYAARMEGFGGLFGDPEELQRRMAEFAEQMQGQQRLAWADNAIKLAVDMTVAAINRVNLQGNAEQQAQQIRSVMALVFPEAVTLVREARAGLQ
jgi:CHASE3 domain sensor protein